jgi:hypothetical protein
MDALMQYPEVQPVAICQRYSNVNRKAGQTGGTIAPKTSHNESSSTTGTVDQLPAGRWIEA